MTLVARSDQSTGNSSFASYVIRSNELVFTFTAPYAKWVARMWPVVRWWSKEGRQKNEGVPAAAPAV